MRPAIEVWEDAFRTWDDAPINPARIGDEDRAAAAVIEAYAAEREAAAHAKAVAEIVAELRDEAHMAHIRRPDPDAALQAYAAALSNAADHIEAKFGGRDG